MKGSKKNKTEERKRNHNRKEEAGTSELQAMNEVMTNEDHAKAETVDSGEDAPDSNVQPFEKEISNAEPMESIYDALYANKADSIYDKTNKRKAKANNDNKSENFQGLIDSAMDGAIDRDIAKDRKESNIAGKEKPVAEKKNITAEFMAGQKETKKQASKQPETEKEKHKKRIKRLKNFILLVAFLLFLIPTVFCVINYFRMQDMEKQINSLNQRMETILQYMENNAKTQVTEEVPFEETMASVSVNVSGEKQNDEMEGKKKVLLTFDDGPSTNTDAILDVLAEYDVKATFFVSGKKSYTEQYRHIVEQGHTIGMHSYQHKYDVIYQDLPTFADDFYAIRDYIKEITGVDCKYYRFPGGSSNQVSQIDMRQCIAFLEEEGVDYVDWNISSEDAAGARTAEEVVENVMGQIENSKAETMVVLMHDLGSKTATVEALPVIIETMQSMDGYVLVPMDEDVNLVQHVSLAEEDREEVLKEMHEALEEK